MLPVCLPGQTRPPIKTIYMEMKNSSLDIMPLMPSSENRDRFRSCPWEEHMSPGMYVHKAMKINFQGGFYSDCEFCLKR